MENQLRRINSQGALKNKEKIKQIEQKLQTISENQSIISKDDRLIDLINRASDLDRKVSAEVKSIDMQGIYHKIIVR